MTLKRFVNALKSEEERRRYLAELRVTYGNALSDTNLSRPTPSWRSGPANWRGQPDPFSCQSTTTNRNLDNCKHFNRPFPKLADRNRPTQAQLVIEQRYRTMQRQARLRSAFVKHVMRVKAGNVAAIPDRSRNYEVIHS